MSEACAIQVYSYLGPHAQRKRKGEKVTIVVAGCVAQQEGRNITRRFPEVDIVMGPQYANRCLLSPPLQLTLAYTNNPTLPLLLLHLLYGRLQDLLEAAADGYQVVAVDPSYQTEDSLPALRGSDVSAFVNVIYGCNERCTYCVVPNTRGVEQSRSKEAVLAEIASLAAAGVPEVTLLGQNIDSWGRDMAPKQRFADLLTAAAAVPGIRRVRFLTSHPK